MLELKHIKKTYKIGEIETRALEDISVAFRQKEMVAILGASGSGKTTCLNIIGGLDRYDSGEMTIKGKKTAAFTERDWDAYRNNSIGFVFQNYNLITHLSIVANVELSMTLSGVSSSEKHKRALKVLEDVGLKDHLHKKPNQLSGGQMQRVAIARALVNNPEILLCDEPTGALDSETSTQILDLIQSIARERLVIMVTHNQELAEKYADRIIQFKDGRIISDSHPHEERQKPDQFNLIKTSMSFLTALNLSFNNIRTKKGRTFLTALASSIGIIGIAVILSLSTGFQAQVDKFQADAMAEFPIMIVQSAMEVDTETMQARATSMNARIIGSKDFATSDEVYLYDSSKNTIVHQNLFTDEFIDYVNKIDPAICSNIGYTRIVGMNLVRKDGETVKPAVLSVGFTMGGSSGSTRTGGGGGGMMNLGGNMQSAGLTSYPAKKPGETLGYIEKHYDLLAGAYPKEDTDLVLVVDNQNKVELSVLKNLGFATGDVTAIKFGDIVGTEFKLVGNNDYYVKTNLGTFLPNTDYQKMYDSQDSVTLTISGIVRQNADAGLSIIGGGVVYSDALSQRVLDNAMSSDIVAAQRESDKNVFTAAALTPEAKNTFLAYLGGNATPTMITLYPKTFDAKDQITAYLDAYNESKEKQDKVVYTDMAGMISNMSGGIMTAITIVLIAFAAISLVVSLIMVAIITYTSVLERTKEIGILKALGARKKDITRVFDAETFIVGVFSGAIGIALAYLATFPINSIILGLTDLKNVATLLPLHAVSLVALSTVLTMLGGHIPARMASKKDAVEALRSE